MARPFVNALPPEDVAHAVKLNDEYQRARRVGSIKALAAAHNVTPLTMYRTIERYKEKKNGTRH